MLPAALSRGGGGRRPYRWDGVKVSPTQQAAALAAGNAAAEGAKNSAYLTSLQTAIGSNFKRRLYRDGVLVWDSTASGTLPISGGAFALPTVVTQTSISAADIDAGVWLHSVENASNANIFIRTRVTPVGGAGPATLSADLAAGGQITLQSFTLSPPALDGAYPGKTDARTFAWLDPNDTFASQPQYELAGTPWRTQINSLWRAQNAGYSTLNNVPEPGVPARDINGNALSGYTLERVADSGKARLRHHIQANYDLWNGTLRSSYPGQTIADSTTYWMAWAFRLGSNFFAGTGPSTAILDVHQAGGVSIRAPLAYFAENDGSYSLVAAGCYLPTYVPQTDTVYTTVLSRAPSAQSDWHFHIWQFRVAKSAAGGPFIKVWTAVNDGALTLAGDVSGVPIGYSDMDTNGCYLKPGLYQWENFATRTMDTRGAYLFTNAAGTPTVDQNTLLALLRSR